ncbi:VC_2705 family sodium/solute symporter [Ottowia sp.]|uniref:VC_2705 family sodium/solute symporter n=1 Tax=Ottowia sp. TaxID=1898956 RepID=UPI002C948FA8|nr:VC_2705 family sodium/solute symporter [Ottowia sp.]HRW72496.1 VC_2705 family sodium/solute symporter [Ottowia sp.]
MSRPSWPGWRVHRAVALFVLGLLLFLALMIGAERAGLSRAWIGPVFLFLSVMAYAVIGIYGRTTDPDEFYVAGRRIPAFYNGMATAADWMSAASFLSLSGALYLQGFSGTASQAGGLAYVLGWTGGFCLVALLIAPRLRAMNLYTVPDFFAERFGGRWPRLIAALGAVVCSFIYVVAQIYGVGLIASRLTGVQFEIGILLGLGGVLLCSFLGGMRAVTWTQVAQYLVLLMAFLIPVSWLAYKQLGSPVAPVVYGTQLPKIAALEDQLLNSPAEEEVRAAYRRQAREYTERLRDPAEALERDRARLEERVRMLKAQGVDISLVMLARRELAALPRDEEAAVLRWTRARDEALERGAPLGGLPRHGQAYEGDPHGTPGDRATFENARLNFMALMFCLMLGTASLPHLLTRFYTTSSVAETRNSVAWSLFFIALLYLSTPALAVLVKYEVMTTLVGLPFDKLPPWIAQWSWLDSSLVSVTDMNADGVVQFGEIRLGPDVIMLTTPELGGLPYAISGLVAAGGLAAALSTADSLLLTISNALVHDSLAGTRVLAKDPSSQVVFSKFALLATAMLAAAVAAFKPAEILALVTAAFSLAASIFFAPLVLGIFWRRTSGPAVVAGMVTGAVVSLAFMVAGYAHARGWVPTAGWLRQLLVIQPVSAGVFGVPAAVVVILAMSWWARSRGPVTPAVSS